MPTEKPVLVVFRKCSEKHGGDIIALFPEIPADNQGLFCSSFAHIGQHCAADYNGMIRATTPATPVEFESLRKELESAPYHYVLNIRNKATRVSHARRMAAA